MIKGLGSGDSGELTFLDLLTILSFMIGVQNLDLNATQNDIQAVMNALAEKADTLLKEIHAHLEAQDTRLTQIFQEVKKIENNSET